MQIIFVRLLIFCLDSVSDVKAILSRERESADENIPFLLPPFFFNSFHLGREARPSGR